MAADLRHYSLEFYETVADEYAAFASAILGRPVDNGRAFAAADPDDDSVIME